MSSLSCEMNLEYDDIETAEKIAGALSPDNEDYIEVEVRGSTIYCIATADSPMKLLHTLDDFLACVAIAEDAVKKANYDSCPD